MAQVSYENRRGELKDYFDRTAKENWIALTSDTPVSRIRQTVRAGRDEMRNTLLSMLPGDMRGTRLLDAGCGTGALAVEAARRGAKVLAVDISPELVAEAARRIPEDVPKGAIEFVAGDMDDTSYGAFDFTVAMDSLIHYPLPTMVALVEKLAKRTDNKLLFTFAPRTPMLAAMKTVGQFFPRGDRSPAIEPVREHLLIDRLAKSDVARADFVIRRSHFVSTKFYKSRALELVKQ